MYVALKFDGDDDSIEIPRLFDIPLTYWLSPPRDGYRCVECWDEYNDGIKICVDCNKDVIDFSDEPIFWKIDYDAMDKIGFVYDKDDLEVKLQKLKDDKEGALIIFFHLRVAYNVWFDENVSTQKKEKTINHLMSLQKEIIG
jgi:hypothetical protein